MDPPMNRQLRALYAQDISVDSPCSGYGSRESSPAPSVSDSLLDIDYISDTEDSDDSLNDPSFAPHSDDIPSHANESSSDSETSTQHSFKMINESEAENIKSDEIHVLSNVRVRSPDIAMCTPLVFTGPDNEKQKKKRTLCKFCLMDVTNFERHLERNHADSKEVADMLSYPKKHPERKKIITLIRNSGNFNEFLKGNIIRKYDEKKARNKKYSPCYMCKAVLLKSYLSRHKKKCVVQDLSKRELKINQASESQTLIAAALDKNKTILKLRVKEEVFSRMKADEISMIAKTDYLIYCFGENYLKKHKRDQIVSVCSNKMRELARFVLEFRNITKIHNITLQNIITPTLFDTAVECAKRLGGYNIETKTYKSPSLSAHLGTSLKQVCELLMRLLLKEDSSINVANRDASYKEVKRFKLLIESQWTTEISSLAFKNMQEKRWENPVILPLTSDIKKFKEYVTEVAEKAVNILKEKPNTTQEFKNLVEASLILTILFNRRRIGDVQYTLIETYTNHINTLDQMECENVLSESEKILTRHYKRLVTGGKGSRSIAILFPLKLQEYIEFFIQIRLELDLVPKQNKYLFGSPGTKHWIRGDVVIRKFAKKAGLKFPNQISSNKLRKQIATVMQILNLNNEELDQFAKFMGHTEKTHKEYYTLPQDVYQTAKVSKLLLAIERGAHKYKGKLLSEIDINPEEELAEEDSDNEDVLMADEDLVYNKSSEEECSISLKRIHNKPLSEGTPDGKTKQKTGRTPWTSEQGKLLKHYFKEHIKQRKPPKKHECLEVFEKHPDLLFNKDWVRIKTFVYNCYRKK